MRLKDAYDKAARRADTALTKVNVSAVTKSAASLFDVLVDLPAAEAADVLAQGMKRAAARKAKAKAAKK